jgi:AmmeMemoRadiSam system protein B
MKNLSFIILLIFIIFSSISVYPNHQIARKNEVEKLFKNSDCIKIDGKIGILISPHAGLNFSGRIQAAGFKTIYASKQKYDIVVILGPSHFKYFKGFASVNNRNIIGDLVLDNEKINYLKEKVKGFLYDNELFKKEYSIKRQLIFIKRYINYKKIIPIIIGDVTKYQLKKMARHLLEMMKNNKVLLIVSTDMSHFHEKTMANSIDFFSIKILSKIEPKIFYRMSLSKRVEFCGWKSVFIAEFIAKS